MGLLVLAILLREIPTCFYLDLRKTFSEIAKFDFHMRTLPREISFQLSFYCIFYHRLSVVLIERISVI